MTGTKVAIGMDMGGTNLRLGVVDAGGVVYRFLSGPLGRDKSVESVTAGIAARVLELAGWSRAEGLEPEAVCVAAPGIISREDGRVAFSPNLPGWSGVPLRRLVAERTGLHATLENDANAAAFGEFWKGAGQGTQHLAMFTLGTGVGGGLISDARLIRGSRGMAGELGHVTVADGDAPQCKCGNRGCLELYASATAVVRMAAERWSGRGPAPSDAREVHELAAAGDEVCREVFREAGRRLGVAMADVVNILNPEVIVVGGGLTEAWELMMPAAEEEMRSRAFRFTDLAQRVGVRRAELGDEAGVVGSAGIYWSERTK